MGNIYEYGIKNKEEGSYLIAHTTQLMKLILIKLIYLA